MNKLQYEMKAKLKRTKEAETQTATKSRVRYLAFDQQRILIIKALTDKSTGENITKVRKYP